MASAFGMAAWLPGSALAQEADYILPDYAAQEAARQAEEATAIIFEQREVVQPVVPVPTPREAAQAAVPSAPVLEPLEELEVAPSSAWQNPEDYRPRAERASDARLRPLGYSDYERAEWLAQCEHRLTPAVAQDAWGGALLGGVVGGVAGNLIAGSGNRTLGTLAGAAVGAVAGAAIDQAGDRAEQRRRSAEAREYCEAYLADYEYSQRQPGAAYPASGIHGGQIAYVPVVLMPAASLGPARVAPRYRERVVEYEEWVDAPAPAPRKTRSTVPARSDKRVRSVK